MDGQEYESKYSGTQIDNAVGSVVNALGSSSNEDHTGDYKALLRPSSETITEGHILSIGVDGFIRDGNVAASSVATRDYVDMIATAKSNKALEDAKAYFHESVGSIETVKYVIEKGLPVASAETEFNKSKTIYFIEGEVVDQDTYSEYICIAKEGKYLWERMGNTKVDLSGYYTKEETDTRIATAYKASEDGGLELKDGSFGIKDVSTDLLREGKDALIINGGNA